MIWSTITYEQIQIYINRDVNKTQTLHGLNISTDNAKFLFLNNKFLGANKTIKDKWNERLYTM